MPWQNGLDESEIKYVNDYIKIITTYSSDSYEYKSMKYSTLQYFHHELKIK